VLSCSETRLHTAYGDEEGRDIPRRCNLRQHLVVLTIGGCCMLSFCLGGLQYIGVKPVLAHEELPAFLSIHHILGTRV
jgi:hypothetical protein